MTKKSNRKLKKNLNKKGGNNMDEMIKITVSSDNIEEFKSKENLPNCKELYCSDNQLTTLPELPNCERLDCSYNQLTTLPELPKCVDLDCNGNELTTLPELLNCKNLTCYNNKLNKLPELPKCIELNCYYNQLEKLPKLPNCTDIECYNNALTTLPELPNCEKLKCSENQLTKLTELPNCIELECSDKQLTTLPELLNCKSLECNNNELTTLRELPNCTYLECSKNQLEKLPELLNCRSLSCNNNELITLRELPNCEYLDCSNNQLEKLPELPNCESLNCNNNELTTLRELPNCTYLNCSNNQLEKLPELPNCKKLDCSKNQLEKLPELPKCTYLDCSNNLLNERPRLLPSAEIIDDNNLYNKKIDINNNSDSDIIIKFLNENINKIFTTYNVTGNAYVVHKVSEGWDFLQISVNLYKYQKNINNSYIFDKKDNFREYLTTTLNSFYNKTGNNSNKSNTNNTKKDTEDIDFKRFNTDATKTEIINRIKDFIDNKNEQVKDCVKILIILVFDYITKQTDKLKLLYFKSFITDVCNAYDVSQERINKSIAKNEHCPGISCNQGIVERIIQHLQTIISNKESINKYEQQILCSFGQSDNTSVEEVLKKYIEGIDYNNLYTEYENNSKGFNTEFITKIKDYIKGKLDDPCITEDKKTEYKSYNNRKILELLIKSKRTYKFVEGIYEFNLINENNTNYNDLISSMNSNRVQGQSNRVQTK